MAIKDHQFRRLNIKKQASSILIRVATYILSTLGLMLMVILYSVVGGFVFEWLESENEKQVSSLIVTCKTAHAAVVKLMANEPVNRIFQWHITIFRNFVHWCVNSRRVIL